MDSSRCEGCVDEASSRESGSKMIRGTILEITQVARSLMKPRRFRFRGMVGEDVWERDFLVAPMRRWEGMVRRDKKLSTWSTAKVGPLVFALSPPLVIIV